MGNVGNRQRWAWLMAGLSAAAAACACGMGWLWVLLGGLAVSAYYVYLDRRLRPCGLAALLPAAFGGAGRLLSLLTLLWTILAMAWTANLADTAFPMVEGYPILGWTLLALAAWGSRRGAAACARCAGVLYLFLLALYGVVTVFAVPDVRLANLRPAGDWTQSLWTCGLFLLPAGVWYAPCRRSRTKMTWFWLLPPFLTALLAAVTAGVLSPVLAETLPVPLYTLTQSVSLFGVMERIEPLLSAAMTMGVFCLLSAMACACRALGAQCKPWKWTGAAACVLSAALMGPARALTLPVITIGAAVFWFLIPAVAVAVSRKQKSGL